MASQSLDFITLDVFTSTRFTGQPLAVVLVPGRQRHVLTQEKKQRVAQEFNLPKTCFLHLPAEDDENAIADLEIFVVDMELPFAGHPVVGAAHYLLVGIGNTRVTCLRTSAGPVPISLASPGGGVWASIPHDVHVHSGTLGKVLQVRGPDTEAAAHRISLLRSGLSGNEHVRQAELAAPPVSIVKGITFLLVELAEEAALASVTTAQRLDLTDVDGLLDDGPWGHVWVARYYYTVVSRDGEHWVLRTRLVDIEPEDPANGSAAGALASYLTLSHGLQRGRFSLVQGVEMGRRCDILVETKAGPDGVGMESVLLGGTAVEVMRGSITL